MIENITLTEEMRDEMFKYALDVMNKDVFAEYNWTKLHEEDRFKNWYHGYTRIKKPSYNSYHDRQNFYIDTSATSGVVTTQHFGEQFMPELVERRLYYRVRVDSPESVRDNENVTLHFKLEKVSMAGLTRGSSDQFILDGHKYNADQTTVYKNFTTYVESRYMILIRYVNSEDLKSQKLDAMPGFRFSWWYSGAEVTPEKKYKDKEINKQYVR